jgi:geranylgeranyl pyrophosphate synthase
MPPAAASVRRPAAKIIEETKHLVGAVGAKAFRPGAKTHLVYLAVIIVLVVALVYVGARALRARKVVKKVASHFGLHKTYEASVPRAEALRRLTPEELLAPRTFKEYQDEFEAVLRRALELGDFSDTGKPGAPTTALQHACHHALARGKRLRPVILLEIARATSARRYASDSMPPVDAANAAIAVECFHAASLVIDDLPAFDNDVERRGEPSVWAATSQSTALMAAISMMSGAFQDVCRQVDWLRDNCSQWVDADRVGIHLCSQMSVALGVMGAASGQCMDTMDEGELASHSGTAVAGVDTLVQRKTSPFFEMAFVCGWLVGGGEADSENIGALRAAGRAFGTAFQVADDIGDLAQDQERRESGRAGWNYADVHGVPAAEEAVVNNLTACRRVLSARGLDTPLWNEVYNKVVGMTAD